jgi:riboflavin biosynthesis pyrimidine reductase
LEREVSSRSFPVSDKPEHADLLRWRRARGLSAQPAVVIVSASLALPPLGPLVESGRTVYVATGEAAASSNMAMLRDQGVRVLCAGSGNRVEGRKLVEALARDSHFNIAMIGGGEMMNALLVDDVLDRLYLTLACRLLGGHSFDTLLTGPELESPMDFRLESLHYDAAKPDGSRVEQLFAIFDRRPEPQQRQPAAKVS